MITPQSKFWYDSIYRLVRATGRELASLNAPDYGDFANNIPVPNPSANAMQNYTQLFVYDELGNIQSMSSQNRWTRTYNYSNSANNYLSSTQVGQDVFSYTYDIHGNMTSMPHLPSMQWDFADRLREVELNLSGDTAYYIYDSTGNRCRKVVVKGSIREERYYLEGYEVFRKFISDDLDFERQTLHISDDTKKFATLETKTINNATPVNPIVAEIRYQYDNHLGSACLELDQTAQIISYEEYHPFGTTSYRSGRTETEVSLKRYKYVGKERDEETGLYYYGARYYAAWICRFVSVDPMSSERSWVSPYSYCQNNPINRIDPTGALDGEPPYLGANPELFVDYPSVISSSNGKKLNGNPYLNNPFSENIQNKEIISPIINEQAQLRISKLIDKDNSDYSKDFAMKYNEIVNSNMTFNIYEVSSDDIRLEGRIGRVFRKDDNVYDVYYTVNKGNRTNLEGGYSGEYATLFEEVYHAWEILKGTMDYNKPTALNEAKAWKFAATAPNTKMTITEIIEGKEYIDFTLAHTISTNTAETISQWFKFGKSSWVDEAGTGHYMINLQLKPLRGLYYNLPLN